MKRKLMVLAGVLVVVAASATTYAFARTKAENTINACVAKADGSVRIVATGGACKSSESPIQWNQVGQAGAAGAAGAAGTAGAPGRDGRDGRDGAQGPAGPPGASAAGVSDAVSVSLALQDQAGNPIAGDGPNGKIMVIAVSHEIVSPRDAASGLPTGKRQHKSFTIRKELDKSTPLLFKALVTNENLKEATFSFFKGGSSSPYATVKLTNANVSLRKQVGQYEEVSFTYQKITWTWTDGGITAEDDWEAPVA